MVLDTDTLIIVLSVALVITMLISLHTEWRVNRLLKGKSGKTLEDVILKNATDIEAFKAFRTELEVYLESVDKRLKESVRGVSTVRFNPFKGTGDGGNISFASAFVDEKGDGVVFSTLNTRERMNIFAKPLQAGKSEFELTGEEKEAIKQATEKLHA